MIHLLGDSITVGSPGVPYHKYLKNIGLYKNHGLGGDTISGLLKRVDSIEIGYNDTFVIEIGTNDILLKYLHDTYSNWEKTVNSIEKSGRIIVKNEKEFMQKYLELLNKLGHKRVFVVSIPCIGETLENDTNKQVDIYNAIIKNLCSINGEVYIDFNTWQKEENRRYNKKNAVFISKYPIGMIVDVLRTKSALIANILSKKRNLSTTIDGVHLNSKGSSALAKMIENELKKSLMVLLY